MPDEKHSPQVLISRLALEDLRWRRQAEDELVRMGEAAVPMLVGALRHAHATVRFHVVTALARIGAESSIGPLVGALGDHGNHSAVANAAEKALSGFYRARAIPALLQAAESGPEPVRPRAVRALGKIGRGVPAERLRALLSSGDARVRAQACAALAGCAGHGAVTDLGAALCDGDKWVRYAAAEALVQIKRGEGRAVLQEAARDPEDDYTRRWALELLDQIEELARTGDLQGA